MRSIQRSSAFLLASTVVMAILLLVLPLGLSEQYRNVANLCLIACLGALSLNLVLGDAGQISVANAAFIVIGGFGTATFAGLWHWPPLLAILCGSLLGALIGVVVGLTSLRLRGLYLMVATLALHYLVMYVGQRYQQWFAGPAGFLFDPLQIGPLTLGTYTDWYYFLLVVIAFIALLMWNLKRTAYGRAWRIIRDAETAAGALGIYVSRYKILAFAVSAFVGALQGGLIGYYQGTMGYESFTLAVAIQYAAMVIIGGLGSILGAIIGATLLTAFPYILTSALGDLSGQQISDLQGAVFGAAMVLVLLFAPSGIAGVLYRLRDRVLHRPVSLAAESGEADRILHRSVSLAAKSGEAE